MDFKVRLAFPVGCSGKINQGSVKIIEERSRAFEKEVFQKFYKGNVGIIYFIRGMDNVL